MPVTKGAASGGTGASATRGKGPRRAPASQSARSMLPAERGASIATTSGDGAARAPAGAGPRRVKAIEIPGAARFSLPHAGAPMRRVLQLRSPRWQAPSACSGCRGGARDASFLRLRIHQRRRRQRDPSHRGSILRCESCTGRRQVVCRRH
jgi:hypothetical protein